MIDDKVRLVKPGKTYFGAQGVAYGSGVSRRTAGSEKICMNILPMPSGVHPVPHVHKDIQTITYLLKGEYSVFHGKNLENETVVKKGASIGANATIVCGNNIGRYAFIGAGAVVTKEVPDYALIVGNPGRKIGWMSEFGERLHFNNDNIAICKKTESKYLLKNNRVIKINE